MTISGSLTGVFEFDTPPPAGAPAPPNRIVVAAGGDIQAAINEARSGTLKRVEILGGEHVLPAPLLIDGAKIEIDMHRNADLVYEGTDYAVIYRNATDCELRLGSITCTHRDGSGILLEQTGSKDCVRNHIFGGQIRNEGLRRPLKPVVGAIASHGIHFKHTGASGVANYFNVIERTRIDEFDAGILVGENCNANKFNHVQYETAWYMLAMLSLENMHIGGFFHKSAGTAADKVECIRLGDASRGIDARWNTITGYAMEPGGNARALTIDAGSSKNVLIGTRNIGSPDQINELDNVLIDQRGSVLK